MVLVKARSRFACPGPLTIPVALFPNPVPTPSDPIIGGVVKHFALKLPPNFDCTDPSLDQLFLGTGAAQMCPVLAYSKNVVGIGVRNGKSAAGLNRDYPSNGPPPQHFSSESGRWTLETPLFA